MLGPQPYADGQALHALEVGRSVREIDRALTVIMTRSQARKLLAAAKAQLRRMPKDHE